MGTVGSENVCYLVFDVACDARVLLFLRLDQPLLFINRRRVGSRRLSHQLVGRDALLVLLFQLLLLRIACAAELKNAISGPNREPKCQVDWMFSERETSVVELPWLRTVVRA